VSEWLFQKGVKDEAVNAKDRLPAVQVDNGGGGGLPAMMKTLLNNMVILPREIL